MTLVDDWRRAWRWFSVQVAAAAVLWGVLPADTQAAMLQAVGVPSERVTAILGVAFIVARLLAQQPKQEPTQ